MKSTYYSRLALLEWGVEYNRECKGVSIVSWKMFYCVWEGGREKKRVCVGLQSEIFVVACILRILKPLSYCISIQLKYNFIYKAFLYSLGTINNIYIYKGTSFEMEVRKSISVLENITFNWEKFIYRSISHMPCELLKYGNLLQ